MTRSEDLRQAVAQQIVDVFLADSRVKNTFLRGSLSGGHVDAYSDIDIGIDVSGHDNAAYCRTIIETMSREFDLYFYDWACSLMPQSYVLTFYIRGLSIFWNVDIECTATPHYATLTRQAVERDSVAGFLKVWALNAKYMLRGKADIDQQVRDYAKRALGVESPPCAGAAELMGMVLDHLQNRLQPKHRDFADECRKVHEQQLLHNERRKKS